MIDDEERLWREEDDLECLEDDLCREDEPVECRLSGSVDLDRLGTGEVARRLDLEGMEEVREVPRDREEAVENSWLRMLSMSLSESLSSSSLSSPLELVGSSSLAWSPLLPQPKKESTIVVS